jgi:hypothetical protein
MIVLEPLGVRNSAWNRAGPYLMAALLGSWFVWLMLPLEFLLGTGLVWLAPPADLSQNLAGHLGFQQDAWRWPPLAVHTLRWPDVISVASTDGNPLVSVLAKLAAGIVGQPLNLLGLWLGLCLVLQPVAAVFAVRSLGARTFAAALAASAIGLCFPALLARVGHESMGHINLAGHFLVLFGLGWSIRRVRGDRAPWWQAAVLATVTIFIHPFMFLLLGALFAAPLIHAVVSRHGMAGAALGFLGATALPYGLFAVLAGVGGGGDFGYGLFSMNLAAPFWPQRSGVFGAGLPVIDATSGQYEGLSYIGAGALLLFALALVLVVAGRQRLPPWRRWIGHAAALLLLTGLAVTHKVYLGPWAVVVIEASIVERLLAPIRSSGRLFWPVAYALALVPVAIVAQRVRAPWAGALLVLAAALQWVDAGPYRAGLLAYVSTPQDRAGAVALPAQGRLLTAHTYCGLPGPAGPRVDLLRLDAVRAGMMLSHLRLSHDPTQRECAVAVSEFLELELQPGEVRGYVGPRAMDSLRGELLGPGARCREGVTMTLCATDPATGWEEARIGAAVPSLRPGEAAQGDALAPVLGFGWVRDGEDRFWSDGRQVVLLLRRPEAPPGTKLRLRLELEGIGARAGQPARVLATAGPNTFPFAGQGWAEALLPDRQVVPLELEAGAGAVGGIARIVIRIPEPVDPRVRGTPMPVRWAGLLLHRVEVVAAER